VKRTLVTSGVLSSSTVLTKYNNKFAIPRPSVSGHGIYTTLRGGPTSGLPTMNALGTKVVDPRNMLITSRYTFASCIRWQNQQDVTKILSGETSRMRLVVGINSTFPHH
jgi:hypothetical protein